jgi:hypothetical protein
MHPRANPRYAVLLACLALSACGNESGGARNAPADVPTTHRALAAAVIEHVGQKASAAAALTTVDGVRRRDWGVEVAFPVKGHDATHVVLDVTRDPKAWAASACDGENSEALSGCVEKKVDGVPVRLGWQAEQPEEDPGVISVTARRADRVVSVGAYGPHVPTELAGSSLADFADHLIELAADPAVGFTTSQAYADQGEALGDDVWLAWMGQGNGSPSPGPGTQHED